MKPAKPDVSGMFTHRAPSEPTKRGPVPGQMSNRKDAEQDRTDSLPKGKK